MHTYRPWPYVLAALVLSLAAPALAQPLSTAFTFQGELDNAGTPASGTYDLKFTLFDALTAGNQVDPQLCSDNVAVVNGKVTVQLDFGSQFAGQQRFLEVWVRPDTGLTCSSNTGFNILGPRQSLTAAPNAVFSLNAAAAGTATSATTATNATQLNNQPASFYTNAANLTSGTIANARTSASTPSAANSLVLRDASGNFSAGTISGAFSGNGAALSSLNASNITTGSLTDTLLSTNIPRLNQVNHFTTGSTFPYLGVGTTSPVVNLQVEGGNPSFLIHNTADQGGPTLYDSGGTLYFNFLNLSATSAWDNIPANGINTYLLMSHTGTFGSSVQDPPVSGFLYYRNILDDGSGNAIIDAHTQNTGTTANGLRFGSSGSGEAVASKRSSGGNVNGLDFYTNSIPRLSLTNSGNVGIGTTTPTSLLELDGAAPAIRLKNNPDAGYLQLLDVSNAYFFSFVNPTANPWLAVPANSTRTFFAIQANGGVFTTNDNGTNVTPRNTLDDGLGNSSFSGAMTVSGGINVTAPSNFTSTVNITAATTFVAAPFLSAGANSAGSLNLDTTGAATSTGLFQNQSGVLRFGSLPSGEGITSKRTSGGNQFGLDFYTGNNDRLSITNAGSVGIGTTTPTAKLDVRDGNITTYSSTGGQVLLSVSANHNGTVAGYQASSNYLFLLGESTIDPTHGGQIVICDQTGAGKGALQMNSAGNCVLTAQVKNFMVPNPDDAKTEIYYACVEGPEAAMYCRGTGTLVTGHAVIDLPRTFAVMAAEKGLTVQITPLSADCLGIAVVHKATDSFEVAELFKGQTTCDFDWEVKAVRKGYEDYQVVRPAGLLNPKPAPAHQEDAQR